jgi:hypothetical protein
MKINRKAQIAIENFQRAVEKGKKADIAFFRKRLEEHIAGLESTLVEFQDVVDKLGLLLRTAERAPRAENEER